MTKLLKAIYENGVFKPLEPVTLREHQEVTLSLRYRLDEAAAPQEQNSFELAEKLGLIGLVADLPPDLSTNKAYFEGFGA